jgi:hypothetical protein
LLLESILSLISLRDLAHLPSIYVEYIFTYI